MLINELRLAISQTLLSLAMRVAPRKTPEARIIANGVGNIMHALVQGNINVRATLREQRLTIAERRFQDYEFDREVEDADGFEFVEPGEDFTRTVYFAGGSEFEDTTAGQFTVRFAPNTTRVVECYASIDGHPVGSDPAFRGA